MAFVAPQVRPQGEQVDAIAPRKMKLSEAIRIGAKIRPQCNKVYGDFLDGSSCAIGAAWEAITGQEPWTAEPDDFDKVLGKMPDGVRSQIYARNDAGESRESIAEWLESQGL